MTQPLRIKVFIVESPSPNDILLGRGEGRMLSEFLRLADIPSCCLTVVNESTLRFAVIPGVFRKSWDDGYFPILHLSAHGNEGGIQLTDGTFLDWSRLQSYLKPINDILEGRLVVCLSSCKGLLGASMAYSFGQKGPDFMMLVCNSGTPSWSDTAIAFASYYHLIQKGGYNADIAQCLRIASGNNDFEIVLGEVVQKNFNEFFRTLNQIAQSMPPASPSPPPI